MNNKKVWLVTGASKGLGLSLVKQLLGQGHKVAATSRNLADLTAAVNNKNDSFLPLVVDLVSETSVAKAIETTIAQFGNIDVVVNNAGYGQLGGIEELTDKEVRDNFDTNVFGALNVVRHVMPSLRTQGSGHIFNISSIAGFSGSFPGWGIYCATKFAMNGFSESLAMEAKPFGIKVTIVAPGYFRTNFLDSGSMRVPQNPIDAYQDVRDSQDAHQNAINGNQPGDPEKGVAAIIRMASEANPPLYLYLGQDAFDMANVKLDAVSKDLEAWKEVTTATGFEKVTA